MLNYFPTLQKYLPKMKPWIAVAAALALVLVLYFAYLGAQYQRFSEEGSVLNRQTESLQKVEQTEPSQEDALAEALEPLELRLEELRDWFTFQDVDELVLKLDVASREANVHLQAVAVGDVYEQSIGATQYQVQPINIEIRAGTDDARRFLSVVHRELPMADLSSISIKGIEGEPRISIALDFYGSPQVILKEEEAS